MDREKMVLVDEQGNILFKHRDDIKRELNTSYASIYTSVTTHSRIKGYRIYSNLIEYLHEDEDRYNSIKEHLILYGNTISSVDPERYVSRLAEEENIHTNVVYQPPLRDHSTREYILRELWILERR